MAMKPILVPRLSLKGKSFQIAVPSSKSLANRALILSALTRGVTRLIGNFDAEDIQLMMDGLRKIGVKIVGNVRIENDLKWRKNTKGLKLFLGNSGTSIRFLTALACLRKGETILTGKPRLLERAIEDLVDALRQIGAEIEYLGRDGYPPLLVKGRGVLKGGKVRVKADVSSQFLTSLLLIGSACDQPLDIQIAGKRISRPYVQMTVRMVKQWRPNSVVEVEGDASAAVYWWALGFLHDCKVTVKNIPKNSLQGDARFLGTLQLLGSHRSLQTLTIDMNDMPDASLMLMALAPCLKFPVRIVNIGSLRVKETDRIEAMSTELKKVGARVKTGRDWVQVYPLTPLKGGIVRVHTYDDHRIAMSMAILGTKLGHLRILDPDCVKKTYPGFWKELMKFTHPRR